jgi:hypothetical protein
MVRNMDHIVTRIDEAATYGYLHATMASRLGVNLNMSGHGLVSQPTRVKVTTASGVGIRQVWLASYLIRVNGGLAAWGHRCLPAHQLAYLAVMKLARCPSDSCTAFVARDLSHVLRLGMLEVQYAHGNACAWQCMRMAMHAHGNGACTCTCTCMVHAHSHPGGATARSPGLLLGHSWGTLYRRLAAPRTRG